VVSVGLTPGQSTTAGSTTSAITVIDAGTYQTTSSLTSTQVGQVTVGDTAQVSINGTTGSITGTVARVGPVAVSSSSYTYPVVIALDAAGGSIAAGSAASVSIDVAHTGDALVVPTSAIHTTAPGRGYVEVLQSGALKRVTVSIGVSGSTYTQVKSGLSQGQTVVIADPSQPLPASSTNSTGRTFGGAGAGGFGGVTRNFGGAAG
jgi:multidrug efflux pump subunit AcrA (membrane-fusion protein)